MSSAARVLIVEDEPEMSMILRDNLEYEGFEVAVAVTGEAGLDEALRTRPGIILLDLMLPGMSGYEVCRRIRSSGLQSRIIMVTARNQELDRIAGLELGADDYVGKPFSVGELIARVRVHARHWEAELEGPAEVAFGSVVIDVRRRTARRAGRRLRLSSLELDLLLYLVRHRGEVVTREALLREVWGVTDSTTTRTVDNFVAKLRKKVEPHRGAPRHILTARGSGYRLVG